MEERKINEQESLEIITAMISRTKERLVKRSGNIMLMWGYLTVTVSALVWILLVTTHNPAVNWLWFLIWIIGGIATPIMAKKEEYQSGMKSYSDKLCSQVWSIVGFSAIAITFCCLGFLLFAGKDAWSAMFAFAFIIVPFGEMAQGLIIRERSLVAGGAVGMASGIFTICCIAAKVVLYADWFMPLFIITFALMMIVPGHVMNRKAGRK